PPTLLLPLRLRPPPPLFPYTTLFRSRLTPSSGIGAICNRPDGKCQPFTACALQLCVRAAGAGRGSVFVAERRELGQLLDLLRHHLAFAREKGGDRTPERRIGDPVRAVGRHREIAALQFVRALRAGLDPL